jgi:hypothetical protein
MLIFKRVTGKARCRIVRMVCLSLLCGQAQADIYKYVDSLGTVHYTDNPAHSGYRLIIKSTPGHSLKPRMPSGIPSGFRQNHGQHYEPVIRLAARKYNLDAALLNAVVRAESAYNPLALSPKGAMGLMQLMPDTAARYKVADPYNPIQNIEAGAHYLSDLLGLFRADVRLAVAAYNAGENNVIKYGNRIPPFAETRDYVNRVFQYYQPFN